jgi:hypothetical protein
MSAWDDVTNRIQHDAHFRHRMALGGDEAVRVLRDDLGLSFPDADRNELTRYAVQLMESLGERIDSSTRDRGREREQRRRDQLFEPQLPTDYQGATVAGTFDLSSEGRLPRPEGGTVTNPEPGMPPRNIPFPLMGEEGRHDPAEGFIPHGDRPERYPALDRALETALSAEPSAGTLTQERVDGVATAIDHVHGQTEGGELILAIILLFTAVGDALYGHPEADPALVDERGEWAVLHDYSGAPARFLEARDRIVAAANEMYTALVPWVGHPMAHEDGAQFVQVLVYGSQEARGLLSHLTEHAAHEFDEHVARLASATDLAGIASGVSTVLEEADKFFHGGDLSTNGTVAAEMAAWLETGTNAGNMNGLDAARDQVVTAAQEFAATLREHLYRLVDPATAEQLLRPLVHAATEARNHVHRQ